MKGRHDPVWKRYYDAIDRAMLLLREGKISRCCYTIIHEQARKRAQRESTVHPGS